MVRVYGVSDSERSFIDLLNSHMEILNFETLKDYQYFQKNPQVIKRQESDKYDVSIKELMSQYNSLRSENNEIEKEIERLKSKLIWKEQKSEELWGDYKKNILREISDLRRTVRNLAQKYRDNQNEIIEIAKERDENISTKFMSLREMDNDSRKIRALDYDKKFINIRQGAEGEVKLISHISSVFNDKTNFNLLNGLNFDVIGGGININDSTKMETQVDHVLVCPKGVFFIETKFWKINNTRDFEEKLLEQLGKIKETISFIFKKDIKQDLIKILLVGTEKKINFSKNNEFISLRLDELKDYLNNKEDILSNSEIILILNEFSKHLPKNRFRNFPRSKIRITSWFIKLRKKFEKQKSVSGKT